MLVTGSRADIARAFGCIAPLQPVAWTRSGVVCCPRAAAEDPAVALARCPLPYRVLRQVPAWPAAPATWVAGWYHRTPAHATAPDGVRELVVVPGEGFGTVPHPTTTLVLRALDALADGPAWDLGCGVGLLTQAWARRGLPVDAVDVDPGAIAQARTSAAAAGCALRVRWHTAPLEVLQPDVTSCVVMANLPPVAHAAAGPRLRGAPAGVVVAGGRRRHAEQLRRDYAHLGLTPVRVLQAGPWQCTVLAPRRA